MKRDYSSGEGERNIEQMPRSCRTNGKLGLLALFLSPLDAFGAPALSGSFGDWVWGWIKSSINPSCITFCMNCMVISLWWFKVVSQEFTLPLCQPLPSSYTSLPETALLFFFLIPICMAIQILKEGKGKWKEGLLCKSWPAVGHSERAKQIHKMARCSVSLSEPMSLICTVLILSRFKLFIVSFHTEQIHLLSCAFALIRL